MLPYILFIFALNLLVIINDTVDTLATRDLIQSKQAHFTKSKISENLD